MHLNYVSFFLIFWKFTIETFRNIYSINSLRISIDFVHVNNDFVRGKLFEKSKKSKNKRESQCVNDNSTQANELTDCLERIL